MDYQPHPVSKLFLLKMTSLHVLTYLAVGSLLHIIDNSIPFFIVLLCTYITEVLALVTHWAGHQKWCGMWYEMHIAHHLADYPPGRFLTEGYKNAKQDNSKVYIGSILLTPVLTCYLLDLWSVKMFIVTLMPGLLVLLLADYLHMAIHTRGHWLESYPVFLHLRSLHYHHHKGTFKQNFAIGDFFLDWALLGLKVE